MSRVSVAAQARATESVRPHGRDTDQLVGDVLCEVARALWPAKTAENLAANIGCTVRAAERYLAGDRGWSDGALAAIIAEICKRHGMRNLRIVSKR